jgi:hypothetical protein
VNITPELLEARMVSDENLRNFLRDYPEGVELRTFSDFEKPSIQVLRPLWFELLTAEEELSYTKARAQRWQELRALQSKLYDQYLRAWGSAAKQITEQAEVALVEYHRDEMSLLFEALRRSL